MAIHNHNEIEVKIDGAGVNINHFRQWCWEKEPEKYLYVEGDDYYWEKDGSVVRHRVEGGSENHELTVKKRKSAISTMDRLEVDLKLTGANKVEDVIVFMHNIGFTNSLILYKKAHIFWFKEGSTHLTVVIYDVKESGGTGSRRFIEVEAEKGSEISVDYAKKRVNAWIKDIQDRFGLSGKALNESLYEIYSGKRYQTLPSASL